MISKLFVFRHSESVDNNHMVFSGWRDSKLSQKGIYQAKDIAKQLCHFKIDYAFTSHLKRAKQTLEIVLEYHPETIIFVDDRIIERCYGLLQGKSKQKVEKENPTFYEQCHRGYNLAPPKGESLEMVEKRVISFFEQLKKWLLQHPGNVAISCHNNSIRPLRKIFENLTLTQMCKIETTHNQAFFYDLKLEKPKFIEHEINNTVINWNGIIIPEYVKLATDPKNSLKRYYV
jgi:2,3-bisphosphoglycerate-dependent phosphoglycerate mutase